MHETALTMDHETIAEDKTNSLETRADGRALYEAVEKLPSGQREAVTLLKFQEMS
jgi:RNA polymerase sigma-70 factor (ECF subfamily)